MRAFVVSGDIAEKYVPIEAEIFEGDLTDFAAAIPFFKFFK